ncbi:MAG: hypothetical protein AAGI63_09615, partial [Planctomycetota bacterium]
YVASFAVSVVVAFMFGVGCIAGWWFESLRVSLYAAVVPTLFFAALLYISDYVHEFGEGDDIIGYLGSGMFFGGCVGAGAFMLRDAKTRVIMSVAPHALFGFGYLLAIQSM